MSGRGVSDKICRKGAEMWREEFRWKGLGDCPAADKLWDNCTTMLGNDGELCSRIIFTALGKINRISCQAASKTIEMTDCWLPAQSSKVALYWWDNWSSASRPRISDRPICDAGILKDFSLVSAKLDKWLSNVLLVHSLDSMLSAVKVRRAVLYPVAIFASNEASSR